MNNLKQSSINILHYHFYLLVLLVSIIIVGLGVWLILLPKYQDLRSHALFDLDQQRLKLEQKQEELTNLNQTKEFFDSLSPAELDRLYLALPREAELPSLFAQIDKIAQTAGVKLSAVDIDMEGLAPRTAVQEATAPLVKSLLVSLKIEELDYFGLKRLISHLEKNLRMFNISALNFFPTGAGQTINLRAYYLPR